jgi:hypothetical protein
MATTNPSGPDDNESGEHDTAANTDDESTTTDTYSRSGSESVAPDVRDAVLSRDDYRCQVCGRRSPERGGLATLHVHHIERDPSDYDEDEPSNLTTLCWSCHNWVHQQSSPEEAPVTLTEEDLRVLLSQDIEILRFLADNGPARTGVIADALTADLSVTTVRERLALLMGLDNMVDSREEQIVDQDRNTGEWGLTEQIEHSARGHIPSDPQALIQRAEDEQVRRALERGCDRQEIMSVLDISRRTTFHKYKRGCAYDFPLSALRRGGDGGQHPAGGTTSEAATEATSSPETEAADTQQQLDAVSDDDGDTVHGDADDRTESSQQDNDNPVGEKPSAGSNAELQEQLETAVAALQQINAAL